MSEKLNSGRHFDFIIKRFPSNDSVKTMKEAISAYFRFPVTELNSKYKLYYVDSLENEILLGSEKDIKLIFSVLMDNGLNKIKLLIKEDPLITGPINTKVEINQIKQEITEIQEQNEITNQGTIKKKRGRPRREKVKEESLVESPRENQVNEEINFEGNNLANETKSLQQESLGKESDIKLELQTNEATSQGINENHNIIGKINERKCKIFKISPNLKHRNPIKLRKKITQVKTVNDPEKDKKITLSKKKYKYKNNVKSDDSKVEKWFLHARFLLRQYKKVEDKNSSYVITYEGKNKVKIQFRIRGSDKKFHCKGKLVNFNECGIDSGWDLATGTKKMENFLNFALENFETLEKKHKFKRFLIRS